MRDTSISLKKYILQSPAPDSCAIARPRFLCPPRKQRCSHSSPGKNGVNIEAQISGYFFQNLRDNLNLFSSLISVEMSGQNSKRVVFKLDENSYWTRSHSDDEPPIRGRVSGITSFIIIFIFAGGLAVLSELFRNWNQKFTDKK